MSLCVCLLCHLREDEHALIQQYCQTLGGESPVSQPQSPAQILKSVEREERGELERIIADLEEEQRCARLRRNQEVFHPGKTSHGKSFHMHFHMALPILFSGLLSRKYGGGKVSEVINTLGSWVQITATFQGSGVLSIRTSIYLKLQFYSCLLVSLINVFTYEEISSLGYIWSSLAILERRRYVQY